VGVGNRRLPQRRTRPSAAQVFREVRLEGAEAADKSASKMPKRRGDDPPISVASNGPLRAGVATTFGRSTRQGRSSHSPVSSLSRNCDPSRGHLCVDVCAVPRIGSTFKPRRQSGRLLTQLGTVPGCRTRPSLTVALISTRRSGLNPSAISPSATSTSSGSRRKGSQLGAP